MNTSDLIHPRHLSRRAMIYVRQSTPQQVEIGQLHHTHFSAYNYDGETNEQRLVAAIDDAARFVADVFSDRVYISVDYAGERCIGSSHGYLDSGCQPTDLVRMPDAPLFRNESTRSERYVWTGPIDNA